MTEILFVRHGQTKWNVEQRIMGRQPMPLNKKGVDQAKTVSTKLKKLKIDAIITSPVKRAMQTANYIAKPHKGIKVIQDNGLTEIDYGKIINMTIPDVLKKYSKVLYDYHHDPKNAFIPGGEKISEAAKRILKTVLKFKKEYPKGRIVFVSHADVIKLAVIGLMKLPIKYFKSLSVDNCSVILLREHPLLGMRFVCYNAPGEADDPDYYS